MREGGAGEGLRKGTLRTPLHGSRGGRVSDITSRVLDLHLVEEHAAVLGDLDLAGATHKHLEGATGAEVGLEHALKSTGGGHVHHQALAAGHDLRVGVH